MRVRLTRAWPDSAQGAHEGPAHEGQAHLSPFVTPVPFSGTDNKIDIVFTCIPSLHVGSLRSLTPSYYPAHVQLNFGGRKRFGAFDTAADMSVV